MPSSLLLNRPLPLSAIDLGRLVRDPLYPDDEFHQPNFPIIPENEQEEGRGMTKAPVVPAAATVQYRLDNLHETLDQSRGTRLEATLLSVLRLSWHASETQVRATVAARRGVVRQLRHPHAYVEEACKSDDVRAWIEVQARRPRRWAGGIHLICGLKILSDARVEQAAIERSGLEADLSVPVAAPGGLPISTLGLDVRIEAAMSKRYGEESGYTAIGEFVYAVQYYKIQFSWFSTRLAANVYLKKGNHWKSCLIDRAGEEDDEEEEEEDSGDGISAEIVGPVESSDLDIGMFESLNVDGEQIIWQIDGDDTG